MTTDWKEFLRRPGCHCSEEQNTGIGGRALGSRNTEDHGLAWPFLFLTSTMLCSTATPSENSVPRPSTLQLVDYHPDAKETV